MSWDLCRGGLKHDEIGLVHPRVSFTSPKSLVPNICIIYICQCVYIYEILIDSMSSRECLLILYTSNVVT